MEKLFKKLSAIIDCPEPFEHGWNNNFSIKWIDLPFPEYIEDLLIEEPVRKHENSLNFQEELDIELE